MLNSSKNSHPFLVTIPPIRLFRNFLFTRPVDYTLEYDGESNLRIFPFDFLFVIRPVVAPRSFPRYAGIGHRGCFSFILQPLAEIIASAPTPFRAGHILRFFLLSKRISEFNTRTHSHFIDYPLLTPICVHRRFCPSLEKPSNPSM